MTIVQSLKSLSGYPIPTLTIEDIVDSAGLNYSDILTMECRNSEAFKRSQAQVYLWLADAPNVSQGGISYSFTEDERSRYRRKAANILKEFNTAADDEIGVSFGYKGENL